jgi:hypothetical protein
MNLAGGTRIPCRSGSRLRRQSYLRAEASHTREKTNYAMNNTHTIIANGFATAAGEGEPIWFVADNFRYGVNENEGSKHVIQR